MTDRHGIYWLASFPKSGNTWLRAFLVSLISGVPVDINKMGSIGGPIASARSLIDDLLGVESCDLTDEQQQNLRPLAYEVIAADHREPVFLKVHDSYGLTPSGQALFPAAVTLGAVYIVRNPLDVAVSLAHYTGLTMSRAVNLLLDPDARVATTHDRLYDQLTQHIGSWGSHAESWLSAPFPVHLVRYEDMLADPEAAFTAVSRFIGRHDGPDTIHRAVRDTSFDRLRAQEEAAGFRSNTLHSKHFFRRGISGSWRDELPATEAERILSVFEPLMRRLGYSPAGRTCASTAASSLAAATIHHKSTLRGKHEL